MTSDKIEQFSWEEIQIEEKRKIAKERACLLRCKQGDVDAIIEKHSIACPYWEEK